MAATYHLGTSGWSYQRFVYFNNDYQAHAVDNCLKLAELLKTRDKDG